MKQNKIIAACIAGTIAITSMSAPVYADRKTENTIALILGAAALAAVIKKNKDNSNSSSVSQSNNGSRTYTHRHNGSTHSHVIHGKHSHSKNGHGYNNALRKKELRRQEQERLAKEARLREKRQAEKHRWEKVNGNKKALPLPQMCKRQVVKGRNKHNTYSKRCLLRKGYTVNPKGVVRHSSMRHRIAKPNLI